MRLNARLMRAIGALTLLMTASPTVVSPREERKPSWTVTPGQRAESNPSDPSEASVAAGREIYSRNCLACHGTTGDGKGPVAARLGFTAGDFTRGAEMALRTDGELFWKIATGRDPMPAFRRKGGLTDPQLWDVVNYIRTLARR